LARQARAVKPASIRYSFLRPQHIRPSGIADRCVACLAAASLEAPPCVLGYRMQCSERSTEDKGTEKPTRIHHAAAAPHKLLIERLRPFSHAARDKSTAGAVVTPRALSSGELGLGHGCKAFTNWRRSSPSIASRYRTGSIASRYRTGPTSGRYLVKAGDCESFGRGCCR
jgi:hypothetical protein